MVALVDLAGRAVAARAARVRVQQVAARLHAEPNVASVADYYTTRDRAMVSRDGRWTYVTAYFKPRSDREPR